MEKLLDFTIDRQLVELGEDSLKFLDMSGRKAFHSQGIYGQGIIVAVVDSGVNKNHPELKGKVLKGRNYCSYKGKYDTDDDNGHGTHVAGTIAGEKCGIAPKAEILPVKVLDGGGNGYISDITEALKWIKNYKHKDGRKVKIVSMSLSTPNISRFKEEIEDLHDAIKDLVENDIAVICSAGNTGKEQKRFPASFDEVICVGAVDIYKRKAMFSTIGSHVDVCQIGVDVISAWHKGGYASFSGTSMSTPIVSGIAALLACKYKELFGENIPEDYLWKQLKTNVKDLGIPGVDKEYGTGFCTLQPLTAHIEMQHNSNILKVNGEYVEMDRPITIENGRFMVPIRFLGETTGCYISFDETNKKATFIY